MNERPFYSIPVVRIATGAHPERDILAAREREKENPFEGGANDVPIAQIARMIEIELGELSVDVELPRLLRPKTNICRLKASTLVEESGIKPTKPCPQPARTVESDRRRS